MTDDLRSALLQAILPHVPFDGWSDAAFAAAAADAGLGPDLARALCPRGALDLAMDYHREGDATMAQRLLAANLGGMRYRDRIATAVRFRLEAADRELVRRGTALMALPQHAPEGTKALWATADAIWTALGDTSDDMNWYSKRAILSAVYSSTLLYWLGDQSSGQQATWEFLDRRIENVMAFEKLKASVKANPVLNGLMAGPNWLMARVKAPTRFNPADMPGFRARKG